MTATQCGVFHESYGSDLQLRPTTMQRIRIVLVLAVVVILPLVANNYLIRISNSIIIAAIGAIGLNILVGYTGQISLGQGAFLAVGAYSSALLTTYYDVPWPIAVILASFITAGIGMMFGIPSLRLKGLYLAVATLAAQQIVQWVLNNWDPIDGIRDGRATNALRIPDPKIFGYQLNQDEKAFYVFGVLILIAVVIVTVNLFRTHVGRAFIAIRDQDIAAEVMGVNIFRYKLLAFATSSFFVGLAGALLAQHSTAISWERFTIEISIQYLAMIIIGGLGTISGSIYGAIFITVLPELLREMGDFLTKSEVLNADDFRLYLPFIQRGAFGVAIVITLILEPEGIVKMWRDIKNYFRLWPFSY
ncbi:MAG: branched-chain amino acid ABC transporter permease [Chloroflexota bacterium]|nr:branched-chain amino acid ABC transporter permease [Chloroflexota bacterium]NOG63478.1 branched-chain amino acid ABC transporter permease [Chloroflexota bacterium]GIK62337.1 MAG: branched-chain amino acid ABC transporter permease [Chloroflexota bacterium]